MKKSQHNKGQFYASNNAIRAAHKADGRTVTGWMKRPDFPKFVKGCGWPVDAVDLAVLKIRASQAGTITGANADLRRVKLQREIDRLEQDIRLRTLEANEKDGLLISKEEALSSARELVMMFRDVFAQWLAAVKVMTGNAQLVAEAERLRDKALRLMQEKIMGAPGC
jgi:hypothetical protein